MYSAFDTLLGVPQTISIGLGAGLVAIIDYRPLLVMAALMSAIAAAYLLTRKEQWQPAPVDASSAEGSLPYAAAAAAVTLPIA